MEEKRVVTFVPGRGWFWVYLGSAALRFYWVTIKAALLIGLAIGLGVGYWLGLSVGSHHI